MGIRFAFVGCVAFFLCGCNKFYEKSVSFSPDASLEEKVEMATRVVPTKQQLAWQKLETTVFFHFGINTFTGREWGDGTESPAIFNPIGLNTDQWVETVKNAGFKLVIITAKHHDGFCLWQTATTKHSVASSPWRDGKGDVVRDLQKSCEKYGLKFGVYLSPWDRNAPSYGDSPAYNAFFMAQLRELLTGYGRIDEVWFDGACGEGPNGKKQEYDFPAYYQLIKELMPNAVTAVSGDDVRWVGNEAGKGRDTEWSVTPLQNDVRPENRLLNRNLGINGMSKDLGSRELLAKASKVNWWPSEVDVSIRPGWFFHEHENSQVKSPEQLADIYFNSVGKNSVLLLNIPPNSDGLVERVDSVSLDAFGFYLRNMYAENFVVSAPKSWIGNKIPESKIFDLKEGVVNVVELSEDITKGQRVESFAVELKNSDGWETITQGTTIGYKRLLRFPAQRASQLRITISDSRAKFYLNPVKAYFAQEFVSLPTIKRDKEGFVSIKTSATALARYTTDGSEPTKDSKRYTEPFLFPNEGMVKSVAFYNNGSVQSEVVERFFCDSKRDWKIIERSDEVVGYEAENAIDGDENTMWHTPWSGAMKPMPHYITIDCGKMMDVSGFVFYPRNDGNVSGIPFKYGFLLSADGKNWVNPTDADEFSNIKNNPVKQIVHFKRAYRARFFKFEAKEEVDGKTWTSVGEIDVLAK